MMNSYRIISFDEICEFITKNGFQYMFVNNFIKSEYVEKADLFGFFDLDENMQGILILEKRSCYWEPHIAFTSKVRGKKSIKICKKWLKDNLKRYTILLGKTPIKYKGACLFLRWLGLTVFGVHDNYLISGVFYE